MAEAPQTTPLTALKPDFFDEGGAAADDAAIDRIALTQLFEATGGSSWKKSTGWGTSRPLEHWHGVTVNDAGRVIELNLVVNNLKGG